MHASGPTSRSPSPSAIRRWRASTDPSRPVSGSASWDGAAIDQVTTQSGGGIEATSIADGEVQRRSFPNSFRGHVKANGYEHIRRLGLVEEADRIAGEGVQLLTAPEIPSMKTTL